MGSLVKIATILSFITAPFYAYINYKLINSSHTPKKFRPSKFINVLSVDGDGVIEACLPSAFVLQVDLLMYNGNVEKFMIVSFVFSFNFAGTRTPRFPC